MQCQVTAVPVTYNLVQYCMIQCESNAQTSLIAVQYQPIVSTHCMIHIIYVIYIKKLFYTFAMNEYLHNLKNLKNYKIVKHT